MALLEREREIERLEALWQESSSGGRLAIVICEAGKVCGLVIGNNGRDEVTWVHSYVSNDETKTFCIYDAPTPDAIRRTAETNGLPVDSITEVRVLDPYFYH